MSDDPERRWPFVLVYSGAVLFIVALALSTLLEPAVWLLHGLQAFLYVAILWLTWRRSAWGYGAGFLIAVLWNGANLFATGFIAAGLASLASLMSSGELSHPALLLILVGAVGHFLMIVGTIGCFLAASPRRRECIHFAGGAAAGFLALLLISPLRHHAQPLPLDVRAPRAATHQR